MYIVCVCVHWVGDWIAIVFSESVTWYNNFIKFPSAYGTSTCFQYYLVVCVCFGKLAVSMQNIDLSIPSDRPCLELQNAYILYIIIVKLWRP